MPTSNGPADAGKRSGAPGRATPSVRPLGVSVRVRPRAAFAFGWVVSVAIAGGVGWELGRHDSWVRSRGFERVAPPRTASIATSNALPATAQAASATTEPRASLEGKTTDGAPSSQGAPVPQATDVATDEIRAKVVDAKPRKPRPKPQAPEPPPEPVDVTQASPPAPEQTPAEPVAEPLLDRARAADRLAEQDDLDGAKREASALLAEHASYTGLTTIFAAEGADETSAQLTALRVLQLAGQDSLSREVARELRRSYSASREVAESLRQWGILNPRITSVTPSIDGSRLVVTGEVENPDVGQIRRVHVEVEALDAAGNPLEVLSVRARPNVLDGGAVGRFTASFKKLDPSTVLSTRARVLDWESEVLVPDTPEGTATARSASETAD